MVFGNYILFGKAILFVRKNPENGPGPKRKGSSSNHPFSGVTLVSGRVPSRETITYPTSTGTLKKENHRLELVPLKRLC